MITGKTEQAIPGFYRTGLPKFRYPRLKISVKGKTVTTNKFADVGSIVPSEGASTASPMNLRRNLGPRQLQRQTGKIR